RLGLSLGDRDQRFCFAVGLGYFLRRFSLSRCKFIPGALGLLDGLRFSCDRRSDDRRHPWCADETKLLHAYPNGRNFLLDHRPNLLQELRFLLTIDVFDGVGGSDFIQGFANYVAQDTVREELKITDAVLDIKLW